MNELDTMTVCQKSLDKDDYDDAKLSEVWNATTRTFSFIKKIPANFSE